MSPFPSQPRIALLASPTDDAQAALALLAAQLGQHAPADADVIVALGGDGFMLQTLHRHGDTRKPVYGMKLGSVGFLMNHHRADEAGAQQGQALLARIAAAEPAVLRPLEMVAQTESGTSVASLAYNEVSLLRQTRQAAHVAIELNGKPRLDELICDGVMVATPAGSTAYN
jgi:NAD+ kinase